MRKFLYCEKWRRYHPAAFARFDEIRANEHLSIDELMAKQEMARRNLVCNAMTTSAFYRQHYGSVGFDFGDIGHDGWFEKLPVVTKKKLREHFKEWRCRADRRRR